MKKTQIIVIVSLCMLFSVSRVFPVYALITDDAGTQDKGNYQLELNGEYSHDSRDGVKSGAASFTAVFTYGLTKTIDIGIDLPYLYSKSKDARLESSTSVHRYYADVDDAIRNGGDINEIEVPGRTTCDEQGFGDISLFLKWRFYEHEGLSFALRPEIRVPPDSHEHRMGAGKAGYSLFLIGTQKIEPFMVHANVGYERNENTGGERVNIWRVSLAGEYAVTDRLSLAADLGMARNPDKASGTDPVYFLVGLTYGLTDKLDLDCDIKFGLNRPEPDVAISAGMTLRF